MPFILKNAIIFFMFMVSQLHLSYALSDKSIDQARLLVGQTHSHTDVQVDYSKAIATVVIFLSSTCPCSDSHILIIKELSQKYSEFQFVGVHSNYDENLDQARTYFTRKKLDFPVIYDSESVLGKEFGALKTPHVFIKNQAGETIYSGGVTDSALASTAKKQYLEKALAQIRKGETPSGPERKTLGCYIQMKD